MSDRSADHGAEPKGHWRDNGDWVDEHGFVHDERGNIFNPDGSLYQAADESEHAGGEHDEDPLTGRAERRRQPARGARRLLVLLVTIGLLAGVGVLATAVLKPLLSKIGNSQSAGDYPGPGGEDVLFTINSGETGGVIAANLQKADIVQTAKAFTDAASNEPKAAGIQPGEYKLKKQMKASDVLAILIDPKNRANPKVTIREGLWAREIYPLLSKATGQPIADYEAAAKNPAAIGLPAEAKGAVEGWLFPATYEFTSKQPAAEQLKVLVARTVAELKKLQIPQDKWNFVINVASIVEGEVNKAEDRPKVARVVENRLAKPMRLQMDSTVNYGTGQHNITTTDEERKKVTPWNTYAKDGLPQTPIGNPGSAAIQAAWQPPAGPWLYFVATNPEFGETRFAVTLNEHNKNVADFQAWCQRAENKGKCAR